MHFFCVTKFTVHPLCYCKLLMFCGWWTDAKRELDKQMGGAIFDGDKQNPSSITRARRPGIPRYGYILLFHKINSFIGLNKPVSLYHTTSPFCDLRLSCCL